ncbi:nitroreductase/quinone reductase family protein [Amycolatopsis nigrescens]|uniref:nitroreductase/quinone reductase family protein n=1 Tax=Amycolatopsis nigrescens TaxID=381445 RepID=UPI000378844C|nr:nitroreductase/quinone reductase family protein [Amycolatopsis nigrescens]
MNQEQLPTAENFNQGVVREFRANGGVVGGMFAGVPLALLTTAGAKTGRPRTNPAVQLRDGDRILVFASNAGQANNPGWYHNLLANPQVTLEIGEGGTVRTYATRAVPLEGEERDKFYGLQAELDPAFHAYQAGTARRIPVVALYPLDLAADPARSRAIGEQLARHHNDLRRELGALRTEIENLLSGRPRSPGTEPALAALRQEMFGHCLTFCDNLQLHHIREDGAFTAFESRFPRLTPAVDKLRQEHRVVTEALARLRTLAENAATAAGATEIAELRDELALLTAGLEDHFAYEEAQLVPVLDASGE